MKNLLLLGLLSTIYACSHPIEIVGEGDVLSATGTRSCYLEDFQAGEENCTKNIVQGEYIETYYAEPRDGWQFDHWVNYCTDALNNECAFSIPADAVQKNWGTTVPSLVAVFQRTPIATKLHVVFNVTITEADYELGCCVVSVSPYSRQVTLSFSTSYKSTSPSDERPSHSYGVTDIQSTFSEQFAETSTYNARENVQRVGIAQFLEDANERMQASFIRSGSANSGRYPYRYYSHQALITGPHTPLSNEIGSPPDVETYFRYMMNEKLEFEYVESETNRTQYPNYDVVSGGSVNGFARITNISRIAVNE